MATLDESPAQFQVLDINTPVVDRLGMPTPTLLRNQQSFRRVITAQARAINEQTGAIELNTAAITQEAEVRAAADNVSAILVDRVTAEALGFEAAILMRAEIGINPAGVLARYQIMVSLNPGGALVNSGMMFDVVSNGAGGYLGQIILDADKVKIGRANTSGVFPFYLDGNTLYIDTAVIRNLTVGTEKIALFAITNADKLIDNSIGSYSSTSGWFDIQAWGIPTNGGETLIDATVTATVGSVAGGPATGLSLRLLRAGGQVQAVSFSLSNQPVQFTLSFLAAGDAVWTLQGNVSNPNSDTVPFTLANIGPKVMSYFVRRR